MPLDSKRDLELFDSALPWAAGVAPVLRLLPTRTACRRIFVENSAEYARHHRLAAMVFFSSQCGRPSLERPRCNLLVRSLLNCEPGRRTGAVQIGRGPADLGCDITSDALASGAEPSRYTGAHLRLPAGVIKERHVQLQVGSRRPVHGSFPRSHLLVGVDASCGRRSRNVPS